MSVSVPSVRSYNGSPPQEVKKESTFSSIKYSQLEAACIIQRNWMSYRDKRVFQLIKASICAAEHSLSSEILRKMNPKEADFFGQDRAMKLKVKFRCGGSEFPPNIYYKIYSDNSTYRPQYIHGKRHISALDHTAQEACQQMGPRLYYEQLMSDWSHMCSNQYKDLNSVVNICDYMKYLNCLDEIPVSSGGRGNTWRRLNSKDMPRGVLMLDVMEYIYSRSHPLSERLRKELPVLQRRCPQNRALLHRQVELLMQVACQSNAGKASSYTEKESRKYLGIGDESERRQTQSRQRANRMKTVYMSAMKGEQGETIMHSSSAPRLSSHVNKEIETENVTNDEDWEEEASCLFQWSQQLTSRDVI